MLPEKEKPARISAQRPSRPAANLPTVDEDGASPEVASLYERFRRQYGRPDVPGILRCFATHPPLLQAMMDLASGMLFTDGALTRRQKEMIAAFVSFRNACPYCADSHGYFFREQGGTEAALCALRENRLARGEFTDAERALLEFAEKVNEHSRAIGRADGEAMRRVGWSDLQIAETIHTVALFAAFNRIANAFGLPSQGLHADSDPQS